MKKTIEEYIADYMVGTLSREEAAELHRLLQEDPEAGRFFRDAREAESLLRALKLGESVQVPLAYARYVEAAGHRRRMRRLRRWTVGVAAAAAVLAGVLWITPLVNPPAPAVVATVEQPVIAPGELKATLRTENGQTLEITSASASRLVAPDGTIIEHDSLEGLRFDRSRVEEAVSWQTLDVPVGGEYRFALPDGTRVWVNSASSVRFPNRFAGERREIYMTGEIYMEVAHDAARPFIVHTDDKSVRVLGTKFNVAAYGAEVVTTLVEGRVAVEAGSKRVTLEPDRQAVWDGKQMEVRQVDASNYGLWRKGIFYFEDRRLEEILEALARWYGVEVFYVNPETKDMRFTVEIKRYENIDAILRRIAQTERVHFGVSGRTVTVQE